MDNKIDSVVAERSEFEALYDLISAPDADLRRKLGIAALRLGGGGALSVLGDSTGFWTKALCFGFTEPVTMDLIGQVTDFYWGQGAPVATIQIAPSAIPADWEEICAQAGLSVGAKCVKVVCEAEVVLGKTGPGLHSDLRVGPVAPAQAAEWADVMMHRVFEMPDECHTAMAAATIGRPGWHPYAVESASSPTNGWLRRLTP